MNKIFLVIITFPFAAGIFLQSCAQHDQQTQTPSHMKNTINKTDEQWKKELTDEQFRVLREHGTERAFTGKFYDHHQQGNYICAACGQELFRSETKFESGTGWPSYFKPANDSCVEETRDVSFGMVRREVHCSRCGGHLGHVFEDGPNPTGLRYCINSVSLYFVPKECSVAAQKKARTNF